MSDIKFNQGFNGCSDRMKILENKVVPRDLSKFEELETPDDNTRFDDAFVFVRKENNDRKLELKDLVASTELVEELLKSFTGYNVLNKQMLINNEGEFKWVDIEPTSESEI